MTTWSTDNPEPQLLALLSDAVIEVVIAMNQGGLAALSEAEHEAELYADPAG